MNLPVGLLINFGGATLKEGLKRIVLEPVFIRFADWPVGFFEEVRIDDPAFERPPQGVKVRGTGVAAMKSPARRSCYSSTNSYLQTG